MVARSSPAQKCPKNVGRTASATCPPPPAGCIVTAEALCQRTMELREAPHQRIAEGAPREGEQRVRVAHEPLPAAELEDQHGARELGRRALGEGRHAVVEVGERHSTLPASLPAALPTTAATAERACGSRTREQRPRSAMR